jgi:hypothetical protein
MSDIYDLEGFLAEQGINYSNPNLRPRENRGFFDPAEGPLDQPGIGFVDTEGARSISRSVNEFFEPAEGPLDQRNVALKDTKGVRNMGESLAEFLNRIRYSDNSQPLYKALQTPSEELRQQSDARAAERANAQMQTDASAPTPAMVGPTTQALQGAPQPQPEPSDESQPRMKPPAPDGASRPIPTRDDLTLSRLQDEPSESLIEQTVKAAPEEAKDTLSSIIESYESRLKDAQSESERRRATAGIFEAINSFGAIATGREPSSDFFRRLAEDSDRPIEELKQQLTLEKERVAAEEDEALDAPNSAKSVQARSMIEGILPGIASRIPNFDELSYNALQEAFPMIEFRMQMDRDAQNAAIRWAQIQANLGKGTKGTKERMSNLESTDTKKTVENLSDIDVALKRSLEYARSSALGGTGPIATLGGAKRLVSKDLQALENIYNKINIQNMVATFAGMSKAVDSDAERAAWNATQPNITNDDSVNVQILLGMQSSLLKDKIVKEAQREWLNQGRNLSEFKHPILEGTAGTIVAPNGEMIVVDKGRMGEYLDKGYADLDSYAERLYYGDRVPLTRPSGFKTTSTELTPADRQAMEWLEQNPDHPSAEAIRDKLNRKMGR